jgi:outer membrane lipoprotein-sorting protein
MKRTILIPFLFSLFLANSLHAEDAAAVLARADAWRNPLASFAIDVELTSYEGVRSDTSKFRVHGKGSDRSVVEFTAPATEKGKYLLMLRDAMWIYMPSASRPIRISPLQRLLGQASNGDVARTSFHVDYLATAIREEGDAWLLDLTAKDPGIAYSRVQLWVDRTTARPLRADFYVVSGKRIKRALYREYGEREGKPMLTLVEIDDLLRPGNRTLMRYSNLVPQENADRMFTKDALGKW